MREPHATRTAARRERVSVAHTSTGFVIAVASVFAAIASGTTAALAIGASHGIATIGALLVAVATLLAVPLAATLAGNRLAALASTARERDAAPDPVRATRDGGTDTRATSTPK